MTGEGQPGSVGQGGEVGGDPCAEVCTVVTAFLSGGSHGTWERGPPGSDIGLGLTITYLVFA